MFRLGKSKKDWSSEAKIRHAKKVLDRIEPTTKSNKLDTTKKTKRSNSSKKSTDIDFPRY